MMNKKLGTTYSDAPRGLGSYGGGFLLMSDGRCFFGRLRFAFFAPFNWACLAHRISRTFDRIDGVAAGLVQTEVFPYEIPVQGRLNDWMKAIFDELERISMCTLRSWGRGFDAQSTHILWNEVWSRGEHGTWLRFLYLVCTLYYFFKLVTRDFN